MCELASLVFCHFGSFVEVMLGNAAEIKKKMGQTASSHGLMVSSQKAVRKRARWRLSVMENTHSTSHACGAMSDVEHKVRLGIGSAAAAAGIFAPLSYKWKGVLTAVAAGAILTGIFRVCPVSRMLHS